MAIESQSTPPSQSRLVAEVHRPSPVRIGIARCVPKKRTTNAARAEVKPNSRTPRNGSWDQTSFVSRPLAIPMPPEPHIELITRKNYGLPEAEVTKEAKGRPAKARAAARECSPWLDYIPGEPFSISECSIGKVIHYGPHDGTIVKLIDDPFTPRIQVNFPGHPHPAMREVQLVVGRRKNKN